VLQTSRFTAPIIIKIIIIIINKTDIYIAQFPLIMFKCAKQYCSVDTMKTNLTHIQSNNNTKMKNVLSLGLKLLAVCGSLIDDGQVYMFQILVACDDKI